MEKILAQRYDFCDFSSIVGFPNPEPSRDEWESSLPKFRKEEWDVAAEHLLDCHDFIHQLYIVHEDVHIKIFRYSLEGIYCDWCRSLPIASISSLTGFHAAFNSFCKDYFQLSIFMKTVVMIFLCSVKILPVTKTRFLMKYLLWKKSFSMKIKRCLMIFTMI
jgi:hypothetical protein